MRTALLCIGMQMGMADRIAAGRPQANPDAGLHVAALLALFRARGLPVVHVLHDEPETPFQRHLPAGMPMPRRCADALCAAGGGRDGVVEIAIIGLCRNRARCEFSQGHSPFGGVIGH